ncbi:MAG: hypothetical protein ACP6IS_00140 [Candidatus Asgardarchaeia archaeon]
MNSDKVERRNTFDNVFQEIAYKRLIKKLSTIKKRFPWVKAIKLSGSIGDGYYFLLIFKSVLIASDYDILVIVEGYPSLDELNELYNVLKEPEFPGSHVEEILLETLDIKVYTLELYYTGEGAPLRSIYLRDDTIIRHLQGGLTVFGHDIFKRLEDFTEKDRRLIYLRVKDREKIFTIYTDLGAFIREARALGRSDIEEKILRLLEKYKNYHMLSPIDVARLLEERRKIEIEIKKAFKR